jgi:hypothetical protein
VSSFRDGHQSGRYDATSQQRRAMGRQLADLCSVCLITEYAGTEFPIPGWGQTGQESVIIFDRAHWALKDHGTVHIPTNEWVRGTDSRHSVAVTWALLYHLRLGIHLFRGGGHLPAHLSHYAQKAANLKALHGLEHFLKPVLARHKHDVATLSFDLNQPLTLKPVRELVGSSVEGLGMRLHVPPAATHKPRHTIDGAMSTAPAKLEMMGWRAGYDHRGFRILTEAA